MIRHEHVLSVFLASPSDVAEERSRVEVVIHELNTTWSRHLGVRLELIRWETHAHPGFGVDAQAVINEQLPDDFDIFIGVMWCRFGTPTSRAGSGTVEEFQRAKGRHDVDPKSVALMVYFKDEAIPPSRLDPSQYADVVKFRESLADGLYWTFRGSHEFEQLLRLHLTRCIQEWHFPVPFAKDAGGREEATARDSLGPEHDSDVDNDIGLIELLEIYEPSFAQVVEILSRIAKATDEIGKQIGERTIEIEALTASANGPTGRPSFQEAKSLFKKAARDMDQFAERMEAELPLLDNHLNTGMDAFIQTVQLYGEMESNEENQTQMKAALAGVALLHATLVQVAVPIMQFQATVANAPPVSGDFNRSKRRVVKDLQTFIDQLEKAEQLTGEAIRALEAVLGLPKPETDT